MRASSRSCAASPRPTRSRSRGAAAAMTWSEPIDALELPALPPPAIAEGEGDAQGRWAPPRWGRRPAAVVPLPPNAEELAFARGYEAGRRETEGAATADVQPVVRALQRAAERIEIAETMFERDRAQVITVLALAVARHLMLKEMPGDPEVLSRLVTRALEEVPHDTPVE